MAIIIILIVVVFLTVDWINASLEADSSQAIAFYHLRAARCGWFLDGCPEPADAERELGESSISSTNYVYRIPLIVNGFKYQGLFALKWIPGNDTFVITTTGELLAIDGSGKIRLTQYGSN